MQDGCDDTPNDEEKHGALEDMIKQAALGVVRKETNVQNDLMRRTRDIASRGGILDEKFVFNSH